MCGGDELAAAFSPGEEQEHARRQPARVQPMRAAEVCTSYGNRLNSNVFLCYRKGGVGDLSLGVALKYLKPHP